MKALSLNKILVLKVGGALLENQAGITQLMETTAALLNQDQSVIIVHGGGCVVEQQLAANGMQTQKKAGLRVTPAEQMPIISGALAGTANKLLQAFAKSAGISSVGLTLADGNIVNASIRDKNLGSVGQVTPNDAKYLQFILSQGWLPIISSIAIDNDGLLLNVNADQAATAIAKLMTGKLILLSDVLGVLDANGELVEELNPATIENLIDQGVIAHGMKVKVEAALDVAQSMGETVQVASWKDSKQMAALVRGEQIGTSIRP